MSSQAAKLNEGIDLAGKNVAISGGTQGIGAATGIRFAQAGASVFVIGRNEELGNKVVEELKKAGKGGKAEFIKADLSLVSSVKTLADQLKQKTGGELHYLITTQGGPPNGTFSLTSEDHESHFAIQVLSRFGLAYLLAQSGTLKDTWVTICAPGGEKSAPPDLEDLELKNEEERQRYLPMRIIKAGTRDGAVMDGLVSQFSSAFPSLRAVHAFPGYVHTSAASNQSFPRPLVLLQSLFGPLLARTIGNTPTTYAEVPFYLAANPQARGKGLEYTNEKLKPLGAPSWTKDQPELRKKLWEKMAAMIQ
ncbi:hypothetical protein BCR35DRAFT_300532 [Leucosporidium creatinivorum]|uniref:NAD(P)-binding protein n=1 Tax=Leucosporidium creatinivorum TaxID=106004 RepID=A0A1Y2FZ38_9BASI|nr:hypothetical protein BCR35DRAFT_300532 [Leucosporidium creatinivorum]